MSAENKPNKPDDSNANEVDVTRLVRLARKCPRQYPPSGWGEISANIELSRALNEGGFPFLSKAVLHGKTWVRRISNADSVRSLEWNEEEASAPGWTWNLEPNDQVQPPAGEKPNTVE